MSETSIEAEILDTVTGERVWVGGGFDAYWWTEGNGSCDCNRRGMAFPGVDPAGEKGYCEGHLRFLIVAVQGRTEMLTLWDFNDNYPDELVTSHIGTKCYGRRGPVVVIPDPKNMMDASEITVPFYYDPVPRRIIVHPDLAKKWAVERRLNGSA